MALGDSYSSGEGLPYVDIAANPTTHPDEAGNEVPGGLTCERATGRTNVNGGSGSRAYAAVAYDILRTNWVNSRFDLQACTGAISNELRPQYTFWRENRTKANLVTISMGGNNLGFSPIVYKCIGVSLDGAITAGLTGLLGYSLLPFASCDSDEENLRQRIDSLVNMTPNSNGPSNTQTLPDMYRELVDSAVKPGGHVVVLGYPNLVEESGKWSKWWLDGNRCQRITRADTAFLRRTLGYLNEQLALMVQALDGYNSVNFHWLDVSKVYENDVTGHHGLCTGEPWLNGITGGIFGPDSGDIPFRLNRSFHPNQGGHDATGAALAGIVADLTWESRADLLILSREGIESISIGMSKEAVVQTGLVGEFSTVCDLPSVISVPVETAELVAPYVGIVYVTEGVVTAVNLSVAGQTDPGGGAIGSSVAEFTDRMEDAGFTVVVDKSLVELFGDWFIDVTDSNGQYAFLARANPEDGRIADITTPTLPFCE